MSSKRQYWGVAFLVLVACGLAVHSSSAQQAKKTTPTPARASVLKLDKVMPGLRIPIQRAIVLTIHAIEPVTVRGKQYKAGDKLSVQLGDEIYVIAVTSDGVMASLFPEGEAIKDVLDRANFFLSDEAVKKLYEEADHEWRLLAFEADAIRTTSRLNRELEKAEKELKDGEVILTPEQEKRFQEFMKEGKKP